MRDENTVSITSEKEFRSFFKSDNEENSPIDGGFAKCHFVSEEAVQPLLDELKVTIRCIPLEGGSVPGKSFLTGQDAAQMAVFAKAY
jgi:prolyl-tRNA synthetase